MANTDKPFGAKPVSTILGVPWNGQFSIFYVPGTDGTAIYSGDFVEMSGSSDSTGKFPTVKQARANQNLRGVAVGFGKDPDQMLNPDDLEEQYRAASTARYVAVVDDPDVIFEIQEDSDGGALAATDVGSNVDITVGTGNSSTGISAMEIDSSTATTSTAQLRLMGIVRRTGNEIGNYAKWLVRINEHGLRESTYGSSSSSNSSSSSSSSSNSSSSS